MYLFQSVLMYKYSTVTVYNIEKGPYLTEKCPCMMTVHRKHKYPCVRILWKRLWSLCAWNWGCATKAETWVPLNGTFVSWSYVLYDATYEANKKWRGHKQCKKVSMRQGQKNINFVISILCFTSGSWVSDSCKRATPTNTSRNTCACACVILVGA